MRTPLSPAKLAAMLGVSTVDVVATLVTLGFFEVTHRSALGPTEIRAAASAFGRVVEDPAAHE